VNLLCRDCLSPKETYLYVIIDDLHTVVRRRKIT
jgi:hypothetical protein